MNPVVFEHIPKSVTRVNIHTIKEYVEPPSSDPPSTFIALHPDAYLPTGNFPTTNLEFRQLEVISQQIHAWGGCIEAVGLYQFFFQHCPLKQQIQIQQKNEQPVLVDIQARQVIYYEVNKPQEVMILWAIPSDSSSIFCGGPAPSGGVHCVLAFPNPADSQNHFVVDMTQRQYGVSAQNDPHFLGTFKEFCGSLHSLCPLNTLHEIVRKENISDKWLDPEVEPRLRACAERAWKRWTNREKEPWCAYCGKAGKELARCGACVKVSYCRKEHQKSDWKFHKHICTKGEE